MPLYNLIEYSDTYVKTSGSLWQYYRDEPALNNNNNITDFPANNSNSISFKLKQQITGKTGNSDTKDVEKVIIGKKISNFWGTLEIPLINCKISLQLKWSKNFIVVTGTAANQNPELQITDTKLYLKQQIKHETYIQIF